jgi:hypothetical protein
VGEADLARVIDVGQVRRSFLEGARHLGSANTGIASLIVERAGTIAKLVR